MQVPSHLALIPDGNRRWSKLHRFALFKGYEAGVRKFVDFGIWAKGFGVNTLTVWALSTENISSRSKTEIGTLYALYIKAARDPKILDTLQKNHARIRVIGNLTGVPKKVKEAFAYLEGKTRMYKEFTINLLVGYGGHDDMVYALRRIRAESAHHHRVEITEKTIRENIRTASVPDVDLIIRTSGEMRLSGFLPWQSDYSELYFTKKYWPDFEKADLEKALNVFSQRKRRFGK
ncbi:MAG: di-trans,poly-cis-decaprenylcistransferase [Candidatus Micrarchaeota archaeon]|nr:di-trans,poly-cis-decaprenylcistransferase [Candidatus Micrarchaeota archaeon]